ILVAMNGLQQVPKDVVGNVGAALDALLLVEAPVNTKVNPALAVLLHRLAKAVIGAINNGAHLAVLVAGDALEFVRADGEVNIIAHVKVGEHLEQGNPKSGMARGIGGERRGEVGAVPVVRRRS